jgi:hypothetical protein
MKYEDWQAERQQYLDSRSPLQVFNDLRYQAMNKSDQYYFGLDSRIMERQESAEEARPRGSITYNVTGEDVLYFGIDVGLLFVGGPLGKAARSAWQLYRSID